MGNLVDPTPASLTAEVEALRTRAARITAGLSQGSDIDLAVARQFDETLQRLVATLPRAWTVDVNRTCFRNPLARGLPLFNIAAGFQILTTHCRRHLWQAEQVRARPDWPWGQVSRFPGR